MINNHEHTIVNLLWSVYFRILGEVNPSLRGLAVDWEENCIILFFYHDGEINDAVEDHYYCIGTEVIADFPQAIIDEKIISLKYPEPLPKHLYWAYRRKEPFIDPS